jgi:hypothetical protein
MLLNYEQLLNNTSLHSQNSIYAQTTKYIKRNGTKINVRIAQMERKGR